MTKVSLRSFVVSFLALALSATAASAQSALEGWSTGDVGAVAAAGSATSVNNIITVSASGADVWGTADEFRFVYKSLEGDGSIVTQVTAMDNVNAWGKAGVMMRESLAASSRHAFMLVSSGSGLAFQRRTATAGSSSHTSGGSGGAPKYLKLTRSGSTFTGYKSADGLSWTRIGSTTISMNAKIYVGLAVTSHLDGTLAAAQFSNTRVVVAPAPAPAPPPDESGTGTTMRVLHWNTHHGRGTDGVYNLDRLASWMVRMNADVVSLNEVERFSGAHGYEDQPAIYAALLQAKTGRRWYYYYLSAEGTTRGGGSAILSRFPITGTGECRLSSTNNAVYASLDVNGRTVNVFTAHLPPGDDHTPRIRQAAELRACVVNYAENRILAGDWNTSPTRTAVQDMLYAYKDSWAAAKAAGDAVDFPDNTRDGATHNYRIDYVFFSRGAILTLEKAQVFDTRATNGTRPSDHKPLVATFIVK